MKKTLLGLILMSVVGLSTIGCGEVNADEEVVFPSGQAQYGCVVVADQFGERQVCSNYYIVNSGYVYWDGFYGAWIYPHGGYWRGGRYYTGFIPGYYEHYRSFYHPHGWHAAHGWHTGGYHGGSYHGGGGHGGHGGHR